MRPTIRLSRILFGSWGSVAKPIVAGLGLAGLFLLGVHLLFDGSQREVLALFLALTACVYGGAALNPRATRHRVAELLMVAVVFAMAVAGLLASPTWIAIGYLVHGGWDVLHHYKRIRTPVIRVFPPVCASFDVTVAVFSLVWQ